MNIVIRSIFLTVLLTAAQVLSGQGFQTLDLSLKEASDYALKNNTRILSSRIDINMANQKIHENLASGFPQISIDANYLHQFVVPEISFGPFFNTEALPAGPVTGEDIRNAFSESPKIPLGVRNNTTIDFTLSQLLFNGPYIVALKTARIVRSMVEKTLEKSEDQVRKDVEISYYVILILQENMRVLHETEEALNQMHDEISGMNKQGLNEETDVDQISVSRSNVKTLITSMESQVDIAYKQLKYLTGIDFMQPVVLTDSLKGIVNEGNLMYLSENEFSIQNSLDFQIMNIQENVNKQLLNLEKSKYLPTISAFYRHQEQTNQPEFNFAVKDVVGANLNLTLFSGGVRSAKVKQAKLDLQKTKLNKLDLERGLTMEYESARNSYQAAYDNFVVNRESMDLSKKIYERTLIKFREGVSSSFELTQIQNQFLTAESNFYNSMLLLLRSKAELDRILRIRK